MTNSTSITTTMGLEWPGIQLDLGGNSGVGIMLSVIGNFINGVGYVTQNVGHHQTRAKKLMFREMKKCKGNEGERLLQILENDVFKDSGEVGAHATAYAQVRLAEIKRAENGDEKACGPADAEAIEEILIEGPSMFNPTWFTGFIIYAVGSLLNAVALGFASPALIAPLEGLTLVTNAIVAPIVLPEQLRRMDMIGICVIVCGMALCVLFGPSNDTEWTVEDLVAQWGNSAMIGYTIGMLVVTFTLYQYSKCATSSLVAAGHYDPENGNHMSLGKGFYIALSYCWIAATLAAYNGLFTSAWSTALSSSISTGNNYFFVNTSCVSTAYFQVVAFATANFYMEYWKQKSLATFESLFIVPVFQVLLVVLVVTTTGIFYQDFEKMYSGPILLFIIGVLITCVGVAILSYQSEENKTDATEMLWEALENVEADWAVNLRKMHQQAAADNAKAKVGLFAQKLKGMVERRDSITCSHIEELEQLEMREQVLERLDDKELKAVIRELFSRIEVASLRLDDHKQACDAAMLRDVSSIAQLTAKQDVSNHMTAMGAGTSVHSFFSMAKESSALRVRMKKNNQETATIFKTLSKAKSRPASTAVSLSPSRPGSAVNKRPHSANLATRARKAQSSKVMPEPESKVDDRTPRRLEPLEASVGKESPVIVKDLDRESKDSDTR